MRKFNLFTAFMIAGLLTLVSCFDDGATTDAKVIFKVSNSLASRALNANEMLSFTPTSIKINIRGIYMGSECQAIDGDLKLPSNGDQISITKSTEVDLISADPFAELFSITKEIKEDEFGSYRGLLLLYGTENDNEDPTITVSGTVTTNGVETTITDLVVPLGSSGIGMNLMEAVTFSENSSPVIQIIFDVENWLYVTTAINGTSPHPNSSLIPGTELYVVADNFIFFPFAGEEAPTIKKYRVDIDSTDTLGPDDKYYVKVVSVFDSSGNLSSVGWLPVYLQGYLWGTDPYPDTNSFTPYTLRCPLLTPKGDGTYKIEENTDYVPDYDTDPNVQGRLMTLDNFNFNAGTTSTGTYGSTVFTYTSIVTE